MLASFSTFVFSLVSHSYMHENSLGKIAHSMFQPSGAVSTQQHCSPHPPKTSPISSDDTLGKYLILLRCFSNWWHFIHYSIYKINNSEWKTNLTIYFMFTWSFRWERPAQCHRLPTRHGEIAHLQSWSRPRTETNQS